MPTQLETRRSSLKEHWGTTFLYIASIMSSAESLDAFMKAMNLVWDEANQSYKDPQEETEEKRKASIITIFDDLAWKHLLGSHYLTRLNADNNDTLADNLDMYMKSQGYLWNSTQQWYVPKTS